MKIHFITRLPYFFAFLLAIFFVVVQPGSLTKDAGEYYALASSISSGHFALHGEPTMMREPGYPFFLFLFQVAHLPPIVVLWVQVVLFVLTIWLIGRVFFEMDARLGRRVMWFVPLSYGLAIYASRYLAEIVVAFLLALSAWILTRVLVHLHLRRWRLFLVLSLSALILTRVSYIFVPIVYSTIIGWDIFQVTRNWKRAAREALFVMGGIALLVSPWVMRNGSTFGIWSLTQRAGIVFSARAYKAQASWGRLAASYGSVVLTRAGLHSFSPAAQPIVSDQWIWVNKEYLRLIAAGERPYIADSKMYRSAISILVSRPVYFVRYALWTGVDLLRFLALPSPGSPEFSIEGMFLPRVLSGFFPISFRFILATAVIVQCWWLFGIGYGLIIGFRKYGIKFIPGFTIVSVIVAYLPTDNIVRYGSVLHPWFFGLMALTIICAYDSRIGLYARRLEFFSYIRNKVSKLRLLKLDDITW